MAANAELVELTSVRTAFEAEWLVGALEGMGIRAVTFGEALADEYAMSQKLIGSSGGVRVMVPKADLERARRAHEELLRDRPTPRDLERAVADAGPVTEQEVPERRPRAAPGAGRRTAAILVLRVAVLALGVLSFLQYGRLRDFEHAVARARNSVTESRPQGDHVERRWRRNGRPASTHWDRDANGVYEEIWIYDREGTLVRKMFDANQDGSCELFVELDPSGREVGRSVDANEDDVVERFEFAPVDGVQERWIDADEDRRFERPEFVDVRTGRVLDAFEDHGREGYVRAK